MSSPKVSKRNVEQTINLEEAFGVDFSGKRELREALGQVIIDKMRDRTAKGKGVVFSGTEGKGRQVTLKSPYSKQYADSQDFKAFNKSRGNVNMKLTGDMLGFIDIKKQSGNSITIGWSKSDKQDPKAYNHIVGDTVPKRPFFGVSNKELKDIKKEFNSELKALLKKEVPEERADINAMLLGLIKGVDSGG